ncbi:hypothetical protein SAMN05216338_1008170 [Bradyrhizobium sp. Rc2d]|uniref:hypothetical protein n=1 Tax=Bradyrhizobium sp. Rc2d TaxID=1855321 RepID=UPI00088BB57E|nr:hypothetical protein [Bradyrhizobium sp. Rc2d]SDH37188.1 hypothetical protein SAMN05216338_1008170 [Bradyrhizobium sp. Rc2d]
MTFQRIVIALLVLIVAGLGAIGYVEWRMAVQVRTLKAFVEGYVFNEAVMACEQAKSSTPFKWNGSKSTSVIGLNSVKLDKYTVSASYTLVGRTASIVITIRSKERPGSARASWSGSNDPAMSSMGWDRHGAGAGGLPDSA